MALALLMPCLAGAEIASAPAHATPQREGKPHHGPDAYRTMCTRAPALCRADRRESARAGTGPARIFDQADWARLVTLNRRINARIAPADDASVYGTADFWTIGRTIGDCEDYMIAKKQELLDRGWTADQLLYAVVEGRETQFHAVLILRTDQGDYVLDNLTDRVLSWEDSGYRFIVRQSAESPLNWVEIAPTAKIAVLITR